MWCENITVFSTKWDFYSYEHTKRPAAASDWIPLEYIVTLANGGKSIFKRHHWPALYDPEAAAQCQYNWSFEEKTFVKQSMISEWEKIAQKVCFTHYTMLLGGRGAGKA